MKVTVDIDCTPEEARRFMGLPDLAPVHSAYVDRMTRAVSEGVTPDMIEQVVKSWMPMGEVGMTMWRQLIEQIAGGARKG